MGGWLANWRQHENADITDLGEKKKKMIEDIIWAKKLKKINEEVKRKM